MSATPVRNSLASPLPQLCHALEAYRRTEEGRVRSAKDLVLHFFPHDAAYADDRLFRYLPQVVRGPVLTAWGLRGAKTSLRDDDAKVKSVVHDALVAGDIDAAAFEEGIDASTLVQYVPLGAYWSFWRGADLTKSALRKALVVAYDLGLFDAAWLWETLARGDLRGIDVVADALSKAELSEWLRAVHRSSDGSPTGFLVALGWDRLVTRTPNDALLRVLDALAAKVGLLDAAYAPDASPALQGDDEAPPSSERVSAMFDAILVAPDVPRPLDSVVDVLLADEDEDEPTIPPQPSDPHLAGVLREPAPSSSSLASSHAHESSGRLAGSATSTVRYFK